MKLGRNFAYFIEETKRLFQDNYKANILSVLSISLILILLGMVFIVGDIGDTLSLVLSSEAEISVFYSENLPKDELDFLEKNIKEIRGVSGITRVSREEALKEMERILGDNKSILDLYEENPFSPYLRVKTDIENRNSVKQIIGNIPFVEHIRDNEEVVKKIDDTINIFGVVRAFSTISVGVITVIVVSHIIKQGIVLRKENINTLKLLGAPNGFVNTPFVLNGVFMTVVAGVFASLVILVIIQLMYLNLQNMTLIPLPKKANLMLGTISIIVFLSMALGLAGGLSGVYSIKENYES